jgi:Peptidase inhibitor family I36
MRKYFVFMILASALMLLAWSGVASAEDRGDRVCLYKHDNFHGHEQCYRPGDEVSDLKHADVGSIHVYGHARAIIFEDRDFRGRMMESSIDMPKLDHVPMTASKSWEDHVGSLRVIPDYAYNANVYYYPEGAYGRYKPSPVFEIENGVCVYERPNFEGRSQCWAAGTSIPDLSLVNWADKISSVRLLGHARLVAYKDNRFDGEHVYIDHDVPNLSDFPLRESGKWNHEISSLEVD